jgi:gliding motility-associated-like protein
MKTNIQNLVWALPFLFLTGLATAQKNNFLGNDTTLCEGDLLLLNLIDLNAQTYVWQDGASNPFYVILKEGKYSVTATLPNKVMTTSITVKYAKYPTLELGNDTTTCNFSPITLNLKNPNATYSWSDGLRSQQRTITEEGIYWAKVSNANCAVFDTIKITKKDCNAFQIYAPNVFSPNGDDTNDTWQIAVAKDYPIKSFLLKIFDQWGNQVFDTQDITQYWDGNYKTEPLQQDTYIYRLSMTYFNPYTQKEKSLNTGGDIFLIR